MQLKFYTIAAMGGEAQADEMNAFLRTKKVLQVEKYFAADPHGGASWHICISYLNEGETAAERAKVDYRQVLDAPAFARFSQMREVRKQLAQQDGVPAYAILTDAEMAELAKLPELTLSSMKTVRGIGDAKAEKYGAAFIQAVAAPPQP